MQLCYHNHDFEFKKANGKYLLDYLFESADPELVKAEVDVYWVRHGGEDPVHHLRKYRGRCSSLHMKDMTRDNRKTYAPVGTGQLNFPEIIRTAKEIGAVWFVVEQDEADQPVLDAISSQSQKHAADVEGITMETHATYDDVSLILRLFELRREKKMRQARSWFAASFKVRSMEEFDQMLPQGSEENAYYRMVTTYWEMVASFITSGVLNERLFFQSGRELLFVWERIRDLVPAIRERLQDPTALKNTEIVANSFIKWWEAQAPSAYAAFSSRVRGA